MLILHCILCPVRLTRPQREGLDSIGANVVVLLNRPPPNMFMLDPALVLTAQICPSSHFSDPQVDYRQEGWALDQSRSGP